MDSSKPDSQSDITSQLTEPGRCIKYYRTVLAQVRRRSVIIGLVVAALVLGTVTAYIATRRPHKPNAHINQPQSVSSGLPPCTSASATNCDKNQLPPAGYHGSAGCKGSGPATITATPIAFSDLLYIQPMGLEIGGHVTPIDHGYFYIKGAQAHPATIAPVYAPLDGVVTAVTRTVRNGDPGAKSDAQATATYDDNAITIDATCTFRVRFSNLVKFGGALGAKIGQLNGNQSEDPQFPVKAGDLIGYTGLPTAQGIDVWVENDQSTLTGFINAKQYTDAESWKTHVVDFYDNTKEPLKSQLLAFAMRDVAPYFGKIDYDQDGKLIGSWFKVGTGGYGGNQHSAAGYWTGHLSIVPEGNDPNQIVVSFGDFQGQPQQFAVIGKSPDPASVSQSTGLVKYELGQIQIYSATTGQTWDGRVYLPHIRARATGPAQGTVLLQLTGQRTLKMEVFPSQTASQITGFDSNAKTYSR